MSLFNIFHEQTKVKYQKGSERPGSSVRWPKEWTTVYAKSYPRLSRVLLPKPEEMNFSLGKSLLARRSQRDFNGQPLDLKNLSQLLYYSAGITEKDADFNKTRRSYPSGGARYPLEVYPLVLKGYNGLKEGIYHYNVKEHSLERLLEKKDLADDIFPQAIWQEMVIRAPVVLVVSAVFKRTTMKYQDRGYKYVLLEAGHLGQNIYLTSTALGIRCCGLGGFDDYRLNNLLDLDGEDEAVLYVFALGL